jgi:HEAT repeat protein
VAEGIYMIILLTFFYIPYAEIDSALSYLNLDRMSIEFARLEWAETSHVLPVVENLMCSPLEGERYAKKIKKALDESDTVLIKTLAEDIGIYVEVPEIEISSLDSLITFINMAGRLNREAFSDLTDSEELILLSSLPGRWENEDYPEDDWLKIVLLDKYNLPFDTTGINEDTVISIIEKIKYEKLIESGLIMVLIAEKVPVFLDKMPAAESPLSFETEFGELVIGTRGDDKYENVPFVIDPDGDDRYINCGGSIGLINASEGISFVVDMAGDDLYDSEEIVSGASGLFGVGLVFDFEGDDVYRSSHYSIGCGYLGFGYLKDFQGDDVYRGGIFSAGAGNFGMGILRDLCGDDSYYTECFGEGFASTKGFGLLADMEGTDIYYAGGKYFDIPLNSDSYTSMSQGFAMGRRPDFGGGIGFLYDRSGNDFYNAGVYAQGSSYWCSAGFLIDESGQDRYIATEYAQGAGIHLSYGFLSDLEGDDHYFSAMGPSLGEGHDLACGILIDSSGNDWYSVSGGLGVGLHNSFGLFADLEGNDVYNITEELGIGDANYSRGFSGVGIFLDLAGKDYYPYTRGYDDGCWFNKDYGIGFDKNSDKGEEEPLQKAVPDFSNMIVEEIFEIASEWEVGNNKNRVVEARSELSKRGEEALDYIFKNKITTKKGLEFRAIEKALKEMKDSLLIEEYLRSDINHSSERARKNVFVLIGGLEMVSLSDSLISVLEREGTENLRRAIVYAMGKVKEKRALNKIISFLNEDEPLKLVSIKALGEIRDTDAIEQLFDIINDPSVTVRSASMSSLARFDTLLIPYIEKKVKKDFSGELLLAAAKAVEKDSSDYKGKVKDILFKYTKDSDRKKREYAVRGLTILGGEDVKEKFEKIIDSEESVIVKSIIRRYLDNQPRRHN